MALINRKQKRTGDRVCYHPFKEARRERAEERRLFSDKLSLESRLSRAHSRVTAGKGKCAREISRLEAAIQARDKKRQAGKDK